MTDPPASVDGAVERGAAVRRGTAALAVSSIVAGGLVYIYILVATRALGPDAAQPIAVIWTWLNIVAAALTFPLEHWVIYAVAVDGGEAGVRSELRRVWTLTALLGAASLVVGVVLRDQLFHDDGLTFPVVLAGTTVLSTVLGLVRGALLARRAFVASALSYVAENLVRAVLAALLWYLGAGASWYAVAILAGGLTVLLTPSALRFHQDGATSEAGIGSLKRFAGATLIAQVVLAGPPMLVALLGAAAPVVTSAFVVFTLARLPHILVRRAVGTLTGELSRWVHERDLQRLARLRWGTVGATLISTVVVAAISYAMGSPVVEALYGDGVGLSAALTAGVAAGSTLALGTMVLMLTLLARGRSNATLVAWVIGLALGGGALVGLSGPAVDRVVWAFCVTQGVTLIAMTGFDSAYSDIEADAAV